FLRQCIKKRGFADVGKPYYANGKCHIRLEYSAFVWYCRGRKESPMTELVKKLTAERLKHRALDDLLRDKGFYNDYGWKRFVQSLNTLKPTSQKEIELIF